jgi:dinuclear metal center YbgI/SA1388 family protein
LKLKKVYKFLDTISPFDLQEKWDNSGLIVGSFDDKVKQIVLSIDIDEELINTHAKHTLFVVHHPLIFSGIKELNFAKYPANLIQKLIAKKQSLIAMHTNVDKTHLNRYVFEKVLGFSLDEERDFIAQTNQSFDSKELIEHIKKSFNLEYLRVVNFKKRVKGLSLTTGAGASLIDDIQSECFITGDIKYHDAIKALNQNLMLIEVGHYETEKFFAKALINSLETLPISVIISQSQNPFRIF